MLNPPVCHESNNFLYLRKYSQRKTSQSMQKNPFKFGSIVDEPYFTNRTSEIIKVKSILNSENHLIIISPRRFGKSSLVQKVVSQVNRPVITLDLQLVTSPIDLAAQLLKRVYRVFPFEKVRQFVRNFRIIPTISINPVTNGVDISFQPDSHPMPLIEDVLNLLEQLSSRKEKLIVVIDEFQEVTRIDKHLMAQMRSVMQQHKKVNYVFLGSQESLIREIFEKKKSPFYHFGMILPLGKIPQTDFETYLNERLGLVTTKPEILTQRILEITNCHPYYTQQLAFVVWEKTLQKVDRTLIVDEAVQELLSMHELDYERLWANLNKTDKKILIGLSLSKATPLSEAFYRKFEIGAASTAFSSLKRLSLDGYITKLGSVFEIDDPFFCLWLKQRREE
jgi:uncharacterized protein